VRYNYLRGDIRAANNNKNREDDAEIIFMSAQNIIILFSGEKVNEVDRCFQLKGGVLREIKKMAGHRHV
jgi:hypothetical protein